MRGERFYVAYEDASTNNYKMLVIGWNLDHEPDEENECGYAIAGGPFRSEEEAKSFIEEN